MQVQSLIRQYDSVLQKANTKKCQHSYDAINTLRKGKACVLSKCTTAESHPSKYSISAQKTAAMQTAT